MKYHQKKYLLLLNLLITASIFISCGSGQTADKGSEVLVTEDDDQKTNPLKSITFLTTRNSEITLPIHNEFNPNKYTFLKLSFYEDMKNHFFLGRTDPSTPMKLKISHPKHLNQVFYEIYQSGTKITKSSLNINKKDQ